MVAAEIGRDKIDAVALRTRYFDQWNKELTLLQGDYVFEVEARKLIEHILLFELTRVMPITGSDIIREFNVPPGPAVGEFLRNARAIYDAKQCSREDLLRKLREQRGGSITP